MSARYQSSQRAGGGESDSTGEVTGLVLSIEVSSNVERGGVPNNASEKPRILHEILPVGTDEKTEQ